MECFRDTVLDSVQGTDAGGLSATLTSQLRLLLSYTHLSATCTSQLGLPLSYADLSATLTSQLRLPLSYAYLSATLTVQLGLPLSYAHLSATLTSQLCLPLSYAYLLATLTSELRLQNSAYIISLFHPRRKATKGCTSFMFIQFSFFDGLNSYSYIDRPPSICTVTA